MSGRGEQIGGRAKLSWIVFTLLILVSTSIFIRLCFGGSNLRKDPRFVVTKIQDRSASPNTSLGNRFYYLYEKFLKKFARGAVRYSFSGTKTNACSIHGLLNQCTDMTGIEFLIAKDVAAGTVQFGHTNTLSGDQWTGAFLEALQKGQPQWWDSKLKAFRTENLVLITNDAKTIFVLPGDMAHEFAR
jgi:hypothetical protein